MAEQELIELNLRLPARALEGVFRLAEQLRGLAADLRGGGAPPPAPSRGERAENAAFDLSRFQALAGEPRPPRQAEAAVSRTADPAALRAEAPPPAEGPSAAGGAAEGAPALWREARQDAPAAQELPPERARQARWREVEAPGTERPSLRSVEEPPAGGEEPSPQDAPRAQAHRAAADDPVPEAPAVRGAAESAIAQARGLRTDLERQLPAPEAPKADWNGPPPPTVLRAERPAGAEAPSSAEFSLSDGTEDARIPWTAGTEVSSAAGDAGLSAEAVSLAFRRDGRRYDGGFPLY